MLINSDFLRVFGPSVFLDPERTRTQGGVCAPLAAALANCGLKPFARYIKIMLAHFDPDKFPARLQRGHTSGAATHKQIEQRTNNHYAALVLGADCWQQKTARRRLIYFLDVTQMAYVLIL